MNPQLLAAPGSGPINLDQPGTYLHWSIFTVSVANLVLIAVMVVIFGLALLLPFPQAKTYPAEEPAAGSSPGDGAPAAADDDGADRDMWTNRVRRGALRILPPGKLLPDRQPAYVASWIYVFGVGSLVALGVAIGSGFALALGGPDWWHYNVVGHFFNSMHLWSVELFMALLVIHLWGKFWMAAWRGKRALTWITGVVAFLAAVIECFTGYVSQTNFDSQWISASGKDAFNAAGIGAFFNVMNSGQMLMWHIVLVPIVLVAIVGAHVLLVRIRGVSHPLPARGAPGQGSWRQRQRALAKADSAPWRGPTRRYDILKEGTLAGVVILVLTLALSFVLSSPDVPPVTVQSWARVAPADFLATAASELNGSSLSASYGPPYNNGTGSTQTVLFAPVKIFGVTQPIDAAQTFVLSPLAKLAPTEPALATALATYNGASAAQQTAWANAYSNAVTKVKFVNSAPVVPAAKDGPVPAMLASELTMARNGGLDTDLLAQRSFYGTDFTKPLLFMGDGAYFSSQAEAMNLTGAQWGVMNETGSYPGQPWLWLYTLWYQVPGFSSSTNVDLIAIEMTGLASLLLLAIPFIPGLRDIPQLIPVHRLIWRRWERPEQDSVEHEPPVDTSGPVGTHPTGNGSSAANGSSAGNGSSGGNGSSAEEPGPVGTHAAGQSP